MNTLAKIVQLGHKALRQKADAISNVSGAQCQTLIESLRATLMGTETGCGLAAPQIAQNYRVFAIKENDEAVDVTLCVNPRIISKSSQIKPYPEACLSVPGLIGIVYRPASVNVEYQDKQGRKVLRRLDDFAARVFQHEYDHLDGVLFVDRLRTMKDLYSEEQFHEMMESGELDPSRFA